VSPLRFARDDIYIDAGINRLSYLTYVINFGKLLSVILLINFSYFPGDNYNTPHKISLFLELSKNKMESRGRKEKNMNKSTTASGGSAASVKMPTILELLEAGVHFGHQKGRWHPKMKPYIFTERAGVHIIDLEQTLVGLEKAANFLHNVAQKDGVVLFVGTKKQGQAIIKKYAEAMGMPYIIERWIGGLFTNFSNVGKLVKKYRKLIEETQSGALAKYTKKEQVDFNKEIERLHRFVGGLGDLRKIPEAVFILDAKKEKTAIIEARKKGVPVVGFCDSNINPELFDYPIPANDDAVKSINLIVGLMSQAILAGKAKQEKTQ